MHAQKIEGNGAGGAFTKLVTQMLDRLLDTAGVGNAIQQSQIVVCGLTDARHPLLLWRSKRFVLLLQKSVIAVDHQARRCLCLRKEIFSQFPLGLYNGRLRPQLAQVHRPNIGDHAIIG